MSTLQHIKGLGSTIAVMFLVGGTCVGGGMLALPVATSVAGLIPSLVMMAICCAFMAVTGLLFVEASLWMEPGAHFVTLSQRLLGPYGKLLTIVLFLFIGYFSLIAYTDGGGDLIISAVHQIWGTTLNKWIASILFVLIFGLVIFAGGHAVGRINTILVVGMAVSYLFLVAQGYGEVSGTMLLRQKWSAGLFALPILLTIFSYQAVVPSLVTYLNRNVRQLRIAIIGGVVIAFLIYAFWEGLILGVVPLDGEYGLGHALLEGVATTDSFRHYVRSRWVSILSEFFSFFAIVTSFLGIGLGLTDFLADGLKIKGKIGGRIGLLLLVTVPSLIPAVVYPRAFLVALDTTGGFGDAILNGMIPALMVWSGRYVKGHKGTLRIPGGRALLILVILFALLVLGIEVLERIQIVMPFEDLR